jgi:iron complex outermembrane receptor protein
MPDKTHGAAELRHNSNNDGNTEVLKLDGGAGAIAWHLDGVYREWGNVDIPGQSFDRKTTDMQYSSDGHIANTDGRNHTVTGGLSWIFDSGYLGLSVSDMHNRYGIPLDEDAQGDDDNGVHIDMEQKRYDMAGEWNDLGSAIDPLRWHLTYSDYQHQEVENTGDVGTTFTNKTRENRFEVVHREFAGWNGVAGLQLKRSDFAAAGEESFIPESITSSGGLFLLENTVRGPLTYELGLRYDRDGVDPDSNILNRRNFNNLNGSASALWNIDDTWSLGLALTRAQRAPTVEELFSNATSAPGDLIAHDATHAIEVGDAGLKQETSRNVDLTLHYKSEYAHGYVTVFHNDFHNFIALLDSGLEQDGTPILEYHQADARFNGAEFDITVPLARTPVGRFSLDVYGDTTRGEFTRGGDVPRLPPFRIGTRLNLNAGAMTAYAGVLHAAAQDRPGELGSDTDGYNRVDAGISYQLKSTEQLSTLLFVRGTNLTNQEIRNSVSLLKDVAPEAGRAVEAGVRFTF